MRRPCSFCDAGFVDMHENQDSTVPDKAKLQVIAKFTGTQYYELVK